jgi:hypothetical protein
MTHALSKRYCHDSLCSINLLSIGIASDVCTVALLLLILLLLSVKFSAIVPVLLVTSVAEVGLNVPTTLWGRFERLDHLIAEPASIRTAFGTNIFTSARTRFELSIRYSSISLLYNVCNLTLIYVN